MAAIVHSDKAKKAIKKIKEAMQDYPLGVEFGELLQKTGYAKSSLYSALSLVGAHKSDDGLWHLPGSQNVVAPVNETAEDDLDDLATAIDQPVKQDDGGNMQDNGGNTQDAPVNIEDEDLNAEAPQVSSHDNESSSHDNGEGTLINPSAEIFNPSAGVANPSDIDTDTDQQDTTEVGQVIVSSDDLHPDFLALPDRQPSNGQANETAPVEVLIAGTLINEGAKSEVSQTPITYFSFIDVLKKSASSILTQDNLGTANPAYCVKERTRHFGIDDNYQNDGYEWFCSEQQEGFNCDYDMYDALNTIAEYTGEDEVNINGNTYQKCYYRDEERTVTTCFTREHAQDYIDGNRHNLKNPFIYVESFNRNPEMLAVRELLICLAENPTMFDGVMVTEGKVIGVA